ncbi:MAG: UDP-N-acetylmuramoyl-L-alanyl-D-glutamate--2,6-diaminopimelate ligase [Nitrospirota bacterium]|nr:UDP-N-acetylmuramoyl-L-alanyl-D-glutamate--2,6-diaminopimelate ligase [Nitrospirota bacterium]
MTLAELVEPLETVARSGGLGIAVTGLTDDSRAVRPGHVFVAVKGGKADGHRYLAQAVQAGAVALVVQDPAPGAAVPVIQVPDSRRAVGLLASRFHGDPSSKLTMVGVTGTNGKTTITYLCRSVLEAAGRKVGVIGTVAYQIGAEVMPASHTTPGAVELQELLARMVSAGLDSAVMEVSSHALALDRTAGCEFDMAVFTNLTQDHLDFHADLEDYFQAKVRLFSGLTQEGRKLRPKRAIVNVDDERGARVCQACRVPVWTYAVQRPADLRAEAVQLSLAGTRFTAATPAGRFEVASKLVGEHNVYNLLAAIGVGLQEGLAPEQICAGLAAVRNVPGRFERVEAGQDFTVVVDYAHTEDALMRLLAAANRLKTGRIITVFGCGGDRDRGKRPKMGRVAAEQSDVVVLTSDNPRSEDPLAILREVEVGVKEALAAAPARTRYQVVADRRQAIEAAIGEARTGDTVLIAGKGHEDYQIIGSQKLHFDDREVARDVLLRRGRA